MTKYVLGFLFSNDRRNVLLIQKSKGWQKDKYNGVGGHIEPFDNTPLDAMVREFKEETGVATFHGIWTPYTEMYGENFHVYCYKAFDDLVFCETKTVTVEPLLKIDIQNVGDYPCLSNVPWLIHMALDKNYDKLFYSMVKYS